MDHRERAIELDIARHLWRPTGGSRAMLSEALGRVTLLLARERNDLRSISRSSTLAKYSCQVLCEDKPFCSIFPLILTEGSLLPIVNTSLAKKLDRFLHSSLVDNVALI